MYAPIFKVALVRGGRQEVPSRLIVHPGVAADVAAAYLNHADREHFVTMMLNAKNKVIGVHSVSIGGLEAAMAHPREVFKAALLSNAASVIIAHNHPSGDPEPSPEDPEVTRRLIEVGKLLGIELLDHLILADGGGFVSFRETEPNLWPARRDARKETYGCLSCS